MRGRYGDSVGRVLAGDRKRSAGSVRPGRPVSCSAIRAGGDDVNELPPGASEPPTPDTHDFRDTILSIKKIVRTACGCRRCAACSWRSQNAVYASSTSRSPLARETHGYTVSLASRSSAVSRVSR